MSDNLLGELIERAQAEATATGLRRASLELFQKAAQSETALLSPVQSEAAPVVDPVGWTGIGQDSTLARIVDRAERNLDRYLPDLEKTIVACNSKGGCNSTHIYSSRERQELRFFREVMIPQRVSCALAFVVRFRGRVVGRLVLQRHDRGRSFDDHEFEAARRLVPAFGLILAASDAGLFATPQPAYSLPRREAEIAQYVARGLSNREIAAIVGTSHLTVRNQVSRIFQKTDTSSRAELAAWIAARSFTIA
jgi:DNA-binding CsgD family transcriptional regulator